MSTFTPERDNLYRGLPGGVALEQRAEGDADESVMTGHFCVFDQWTEISSWYEGEFVERVAAGAARKTLREDLARCVVQYDHGYDDYIGSSPLGVIDVAREDDTGVYYEVPLLDTDYNRDRVLPLLQGRLLNGDRRGSVLGSSFRFNVIKDEWLMEPKPSTYNPKGLPERTIREFRLREFGPVVFPAYAGATAGVGPGMRSLSDHYMERRREARSASISAGAALGTPAQNPPEPPQEHSVVIPQHLRLARLQAVLASHRP